jgi:hypothetical protein
MVNIVALRSWGHGILPNELVYVACTQRRKAFAMTAIVSAYLTSFGLSVSVTAEPRSVHYYCLEHFE